jgi:hypothetical protein
MKKKIKSDPKPKSYYQELEKQLREEAINRPLDETNKGFKLLQKMGFKSIKTNETIDNKTEKGLQTFNEPIKIELKNDRKGFGSQKVVKCLKRKEFSDKINDKITEEKFLNHKKSRNQLLLIEKDFKTCQKICRNLDIDSGIDEKQFLRQTLRPKWFWPTISTEEVGNEEEECEDLSEDESDISVEQKLFIINEYLRNKYFYCIWCGIKFNDSNDIKDNCLGNTRDDHQ